LLVVILYLGIRGILHGNAVTGLDSHTYRGESPRRVAAFADANSPLRWYGVVETESALHAAEVEFGPGARFDPESAATAYKPESSAALNAARDTPSARRLLAAARFPKATVEGTTTGFHVTLREYASASSAPVTQVEALIDTDSVGKVTSQELAWIPNGTGRKD
jgi:hypothetical protein